ncbi:nucleotidyltransferase substrate binding protein [Patescibacteria group bacterium]|nr:nucleotidyltransferase substrate binding protein [Patescibacteria group bacterium]MCG2702394.1 nucleotidyltransferase substrate binding protein [Candidatus Parcubacteria bacterium]MBU4264835.1 nucleotidyltransferase substrate binding protein [Patescibacteria group bacterium]MBU4389706.1 nucleotidyltransferase substrate binding protein [Patescibacteria group bacterium]MBU4397401.1 nucleotidyltransferase substrate binding protein [Patescibacteria group bacterium]
MTKKQSLLTDLKKTTASLEKVLKLPESEINRDASIQRFEFTFELSWKLMQELVADVKKGAYGPRTVIREAANIELISNPKKWLYFLDKRNLTVHTYNEAMAKEMYQVAKEFISHVKNLTKQVKEYLS